MTEIFLHKARQITHVILQKRGQQRVRRESNTATMEGTNVPTLCFEADCCLSSLFFATTKHRPCGPSLCGIHWELTYWKKAYQCFYNSWFLLHDERFWEPYNEDVKRYEMSPGRMFWAASWHIMHCAPVCRQLVSFLLAILRRPWKCQVNTGKSQPGTGIHTR